MAIHRVHGIHSVRLTWLSNRPQTTHQGIQKPILSVKSGEPAGIRTQDTIIVTPMVQALRGETPAWAVVVPIGIVAIVVLALLRWLLVSTTAAQRPGFALRP
jgi:hypothetical protein